MTMDPETGDAIRATHQALAAINAKLDVLVSQHGTVAGRVDDHEVRLRSLEAEQVVLVAKAEDLSRRDADQEERLRRTDRWRYAMPVTAAGAGGALLAGTAALVTAVQGG